MRRAHTGWRRYAAPAAFLLAVTIAVVVIRSGLQSSHTSTAPGRTTSVTTRGTTTGTAKSKRFYTVQPGDSFGVIAGKTGVSVAVIEKLNPKLASTALHVGQRVRIR